MPAPTVAGYQPRLPMLPQQERAFLRSHDKDVFAWVMAPRLGKTKLFIDNAAHLYQQGQIDTAFVLAPNGVHRNWLLELQKHLPEGLPVAAAFYRGGTVNKEIRRVMERDDCLRFITMNIDAMSYPSGLAFAQKLLVHAKAIGGIDESHRFKTPSSLRTRNVWKLRPLLRYRRIMTGTVTTQGLEDLYAQYAFLDPLIIGCRTFTEFKSAYCLVTVYGAGGTSFSKITGYKNVDQLQRRLAPWTFVATKEEYMAHLPPQEWVELETELSAEQRRMLAELRDYYLTELSDGRVLDAKLAITRLLRMQQITAGHVPGEEKGTWRPVPTPRLADAVDVVKYRMPGKGIIWAVWRADVEQLIAALRAEGITAVPYYGDVPREEAEANLERWKTDPALKILVGTPRKGGIGLPLHAADTVLNYSWSFSWEDWHQSQERNHGPLQTRPCTYYTLVAPGSPNRRMLRVVQAKESISKLISAPGALEQWLRQPDPEAD